jgi:hypothetical protein
LSVEIDAGSSGATLYFSGLLLVVLRSEFPQYSPTRNQLLNRHCIRELLAVQSAISIGGLINPLHSVVTEHVQSSGEFDELLPAQNRFAFRAAGHAPILAGSLFVRQAMEPEVCLC